MTPVSPSETIAKADRIWAYTNARGSRVWTPMKPAIAGAHEEEEYVCADVHSALVLHVEAMKRREELLVGGLCGSTAMRFAVGAGEHSLALHFVNSETLDMFQDGLRAYIDFARARTLIQGEKP